MVKENKEMKTTLRMKIKTGAFALALTTVANITLAQYPPASHLATSWWEWALETPASENPLTDTTGQFAAVNQPNGSVWFLAVTLAAQWSAQLPCHPAKLCSFRL
jgi:hypothetical protein